MLQKNNDEMLSRVEDREQQPRARTISPIVLFSSAAKEYHLAPSSSTFETDGVEGGGDDDDDDDANELRALNYRSTKIIMSLSYCRFSWRPRLLAVLLTLALVCSITSSLYCDFLYVTLGFVPQGYDTGDKVGIALWSFQGPDRRCQSFQDAYKLGGFSNGDKNYSNWITNGDMAWTISRALAVVGVVFGAIALVCILINLCTIESHLVDVLAYTVVIALVSEAAKLGLFFSIDLCASATFWHNDEIDEYFGSTCGMSQGAFICIGSIVVYFISGVLLIGYNTRPKIYDYDYDENSLQEMTVAGKTNTTQSTSFLSSKKSQTSAWTGSPSPAESRIEPISGVDDGFNQTNSHMGSHHRGGSQGGSHNMSSHVGSYGTHLNSDRRRSSQETHYSEVEEAVEEEDDYDVMQPLPQFHRSGNPSARRMIDDDMSAITMDTMDSSNQTAF